MSRLLKNKQELIRHLKKIEIVKIILFGRFVYLPCHQDPRTNVCKAVPAVNLC